MKHVATSPSTFPKAMTHGNYIQKQKDFDPKDRKTNETEASQDKRSACMKHIGEHIRSLRIEKGYSSAEIFAYEYNLNRVSYWRMEKGHNMTMHSLLRVLDIHCLTLKEFFQEFE